MRPASVLSCPICCPVRATCEGSMWTLTSQIIADGLKLPLQMKHRYKFGVGSGESEEPCNFSLNNYRTYLYRRQILK